jgi:hypothetical protein
LRRHVAAKIKRSLNFCYLPIGRMVKPCWIMEVFCLL